MTVTEIIIAQSEIIIAVAVIIFNINRHSILYYCHNYDYTRDNYLLNRH